MSLFLMSGAIFGEKFKEPEIETSFYRDSPAHAKQSDYSRGRNDALLVYKTSIRKSEGVANPVIQKLCYGNVNVKPDQQPALSNKNYESSLISRLYGETTATDSLHRTKTYSSVQSSTRVEKSMYCQSSHALRQL